ncbi:ProQ/FinO family protein [Chitinibacter fontanus]|uniref:ProQ/FinO family protein n=1 Tax=Chitinibacter fontanus TaxID=1737446 RepID=A0A7D5ZGT3_9NEIS|nr:ProQ/FinO family protein [Chitinibacter fontanus]QLI81669.1 ProQ/FinO family protein [Chitinibacter fontanus]
MNTPEKKPTSTPTTFGMLKDLQKQFAVFRDCLPLAIGIDKQVIAQLPEVNRRILRSALAMHTRSVRYLKVMQNATERVNLDGSKADAVTEEQRTFAATSLHEHFKKAANERKAQQAAEAAAEAERQRAEKLNQLAQKFSRN